MFLTVLLLLSAMGLSTIAGYYSVAGMTAIFAASWWPIVIMTGTLEFSKIVVSSWLYRNWHKTPKVLKIYFTSAVLILMFITSLGIFGYLSKAHIDQLASVSDNPLFIKQIDQQIATEQARVDDTRKIITQMDAAVNSIISQSTTETAQRANKGASIAKQANLVRDSQKKDRIALNKAIDESNSKIKELNKERLKLEQDQIKIEAEVGPIKYIAQMMYGDNPDKNLLEKSVRYIIILIIIVFDPLAVLMFIAANMSMVQFMEEREELKKQKIKEPVNHTPPPLPKAAPVDEINTQIQPIDDNKEPADLVVPVSEDPVTLLDNVELLVETDSLSESISDIQINNVTFSEEVVELVDLPLEEPVIEKKDEITDIDSILVKDLILLQEPVIEEPVVEEPVTEEIELIEEPVTEEIELIEELVIEEDELIEEPIDDVSIIEEIIEAPLTEVSDLELKLLIDEVLENLKAIDGTETSSVQESDPVTDDNEIEPVAETVDDSMKEVNIESTPEVVEELTNETTFIDGKPIQQFLEVQTETEVPPAVYNSSEPNQMLQFTSTPAIVRKPDDILSTIKKYHNVRLDDARRTLR